MIINILSKNIFLADILYKNPNTDQGLYLMPLKKGVIVGNVVSANQYDVVFQDSKYSYLPEESNAIDFQSYCSPLVVLDICSSLFGHLLKNKEEVLSKEISWLGKPLREVDAEECIIEVPNFYIHSGWAKGDSFLLCKYFNQLTVQHKSGRNYHLTIKAKSVFEAMNLLCITAMFTHITNQYGIFTYIDDYFSQKYARILCNVDHVPYFVFYLFIGRAVKNDQQFENIKLPFENYLATQGLNCELTSYRTHEGRIKYITKLVNPEYPMLDVGCGELMYYRRIRSMKYFGTYIAVDEDPTLENLVINMQDRYGDENLEFFTQLDEVPKLANYTILLTEVIEHNGVEEAKALIQKLLEYSYNQFIITTPNSDFNQYYHEELEKRHDDHDFEMSKSEFTTFIEEIIGHRNDIVAIYDGIGDTINGVQPTQVCILKPAEVVKTV